MKFVQSGSWRKAVGRAATLAALGSLLNGCGGGGDEPTVSVFNEIYSGYLVEGPGASAKEEQALRRAGLSTTNKRCRLSSGRDLDGNQVGGFVDGIHPRNVIFDIPASQLEKAKALSYLPYDPKQWWQGELPFREFKCEDMGL